MLRKPRNNAKPKQPSRSRTVPAARPNKVEEPKPEVRKNLSFEDIKIQLASWAENEHIPGKFQAWFTKDANSENADWCILHKMVKDHEVLVIDAPAKEMDAPEVVNRVNEQLKKDHLRLFRKAIRTIWFRATGDGRFALLVQINLRGKNSAHAYKTFLDFLERGCPEIISCHQIECTPNLPFNPSGNTPVRIESKNSFGSDFMPLANTGLYMHVLDWAPRIKDAWLELPKRIKDAIHPTAGDKLFEFYSGSSYVGASLAGLFQQVDVQDCRECAMLSSRYNARVLSCDNFHFHRGHLEESTFAKFFGKAENEGRWTFYFNLPYGETLPAGVEAMATASRPERILLQTGDLEVAAKEIKRFRREGFVLRKNIPLYLEPGSGKFELLMLFVPDRAGLLGLNPAQKAKSRSVQKPQERIFTQKQGNIPHFATETPTFKQRKG